MNWSVFVYWSNGLCYLGHWFNCKETASSLAVVALLHWATHLVFNTKLTWHIAYPSLLMNMSFLLGWPQFQQLGMTLVEISQHAYTSLYNDGLVQDCSISSALAMEILQSCTKSSISGLEIKPYEVLLSILLNKLGFLSLRTRMVPVELVNMISPHRLRFDSYDYCQMK